MAEPPLTRRIKTEAATALRFAIVGALATLTHAATALVFLNAGLLQAFPANIAGFLIAFIVSFSGHHFWSFAHLKDGASTRRRMRRFFLLALCGFALNSGILASWLALTDWPEAVGILISIAAVPVMTFLGARLWAFSGPASTGRNDKGSRP